MNSHSVKVDADTAIAATALVALLEAPAGADIRARAAISVDTLERVLAATTRFYLTASTLLNNARMLRPDGLPSSEYTFEILNGHSVAAHAVVRWYAGDPAGARAAAIAQQAAAGKFDPETQRIGAAPVKEVAL